MKDRLSKLTVASGILGLVLLLGVMLSGAAYPSLVFRIGAPLGLLFVFLSVGLLGLRYLRDICGICGTSVRPFGRNNGCWPWHW